MFKEYFGELLTLCVFISVALSMAHPRLKRTISFGAGILIICSVMLPLVDIFCEFDADEVFEKILIDIKYEGATDSSIELAFEEGIAKYVAEAYEVDEGSVSVSADGFDISTLRAERIYVTLSEKAIYLDYKRIEREISERFTSGGECEVSINVKG